MVFENSTDHFLMIVSFCIFVGTRLGNREVKVSVENNQRVKKGLNIKIKTKSYGSYTYNSDYLFEHLY